MRLGVHINRFNHSGGGPALGTELAAAGAAAEAAGVHRLTVMDHYFQMEFNGGAEDAMLEAYTTLGFLAAHTSTVRLGALVTGVTYRHPGLLAKIATTLDVLSGGRATLGIGAAWYDREHEGLGVPYPSTAERFERLEETLRICLQMWDPDDNGPFEGTHYRLAETLCVPAPVSSPRPEIMIGGGGERKTLRLVAQYADACNLFASTPEEIGHKLDVLRGHCDSVGRPYDDITRTLLYMGDAADENDVDGFVRDIEGYAKFGIETVMLAPRTGEPAAWIEEFAAPAVRRAAELG
ncbi:LLM class F420-dependent oxidoreductase [Streptomyces turgidiscabies]|uniref:F420-dependent oxidoreductase family protein n=1 Tax=Streptomyces turgidiscabies (strain Car8) TaxID=698760 RepID=L7F076_STRT8|nr:MULTISPECIES: LLM class F420-dependent oxidoreductase [Streptomyces]ELP64667.1 F420-dependent oxidoreductase family protein [Streptomyces turgidiscabies Car8]MDX3491725.1 LLM class F420-dependent oxidoreductase [Streptomyces turgidiscabies]GAQ73332.1 phthiodiolone/phenolphthiodiolone dimycocerosates ketoreductase [Streptomyces turgidiscabies]